MLTQKSSNDSKSKFQNKTKAKAKPKQSSLRMKLQTFPIGGIPQTRLVRLRHCQEIALNAEQNSWAQKQFWLNCPANVTGDQTPKAIGGWSTWYGMYRKATVLDVKLQFLNTPPSSPNNSSGFQPGFMGIYVSEDSSEFATTIANGIPNLFEQPRNVLCKSLPHAFNTQNKDCYLTKYCDVSDFFSVPTSSLYTAEDDYSTTDQNPDKKIYGSVYIASVADNDPTTVIGLVTIDMLIRFQDPRDIRAN